MSAQGMLILLAGCFGQVDAAAAVAAGRLGDRHVEGMYGFSICPPTGWSVVRVRQRHGRGVTLLRMARRLEAGRFEEMAFNRRSTRRDAAMGEVLERIYHDFEMEFSNVEVLSQQVQEIAGRPGALFTAFFWRQGFKWLRLQAILEARPRKYLTLVYDGPAAVRRQSEPLFHLVLGSLRLLRERVSRADLEKAFEEGGAWLADLRSKDLREAILPEQFLKFEIDGQAVGCLVVYETEAIQKGRSGVEVREGGWLFESDGRVRRMEANLFIGDDLQEEEVKASVTTLVPPAGGEGSADLEIALEEKVRAGDVLLTSQTYHLGLPTAQNPPIRLPRWYLPTAVLRMLPRLVGELSRPRLLAFVEFDHRRVELVIRIVALRGASELPGGARRGKVFLIEEYQGVAGEPRQVYVDEAGRVLMTRMGNLTLVPTKPEDLDRRFGARLDRVERDLTRLEKAYKEQQRRFEPKGRSKGRGTP